MNQILKIAKTIIAAGQIKKFKQYLKKENISEDQIEIVSKKVLKDAVDIHWFVYNFIKENKHFQDINVKLKDLQDYNNLNKQLKVDHKLGQQIKTFSDLSDFLNSFKSHQIKKTQFSAPTKCPLVLSKGKYNFYYADAKDEQCFNDLHTCNTAKNGQQYAMWCVVTGTRDWGNYTISQFPFYIYTTDKNNKPIALFNFGYDYDAQIKNIHDDPFKTFDQDLIYGIKQLAEKYNFNIKDNHQDYRYFNEINNILDKEVNINESDKNNEFNGLVFFDYFIFNTKTNQKDFIILHDNLKPLHKSKIDQNLINLLIHKHQNNILYNLITKEQIKQSNKKLFDKITNYFLYHQTDYLMSLNQEITFSEQNVTKFFNYLFSKNDYVNCSQLLMRQKNINDKLIDDFSIVMIKIKKYNFVYGFIVSNSLKNQEIKQQFIKALIKDNQLHLLYTLFLTKRLNEEQKKIVFEEFIKQDKQQYCNSILECQITIPQQLKQKYIKKLLQEEKFASLSILVERDVISDPKIITTLIQKQQLKPHSIADIVLHKNILSDQLINKISRSFLTFEHFKILKQFILKDKIKDNQLVHDIIQTMINSDIGYIGIQRLLDRDKIKDKDLINQIILKFSNGKYCNAVLVEKCLMSDVKPDNDVILQSLQNLVKNYSYQYQINQWICQDFLIKDQNCINWFFQLILNKNNGQFNIIQNLISKDFIKDQKLIDKGIQFLLNGKCFILLNYLINENKISIDNHILKNNERFMEQFRQNRISKHLYKIASVLISQHLFQFVKPLLKQFEAKFNMLKNKQGSFTIEFQNNIIEINVFNSDLSKNKYDCGVAQCTQKNNQYIIDIYGCNAFDKQWYVNSFEHQLMHLCQMYFGYSTKNQRRNWKNIVYNDYDWQNDFDKDRSVKFNDKLQFYFTDQDEYSEYLNDTINYFESLIENNIYNKQQIFNILKNSNIWNDKNKIQNYFDMNVDNSEALQFLYFWHKKDKNRFQQIIKQIYKRI